ncbi:MAG: hypothetical protein HGA53_01860, partial [Anaerolineaceae bacterium]|nr:hypothetical protein [Anaerolineaceae bacterium]
KNNRTTQKLAVGSLLSVQTQAQLLDAVKGSILRVEIPGACTPELLDALLPRLEGRELIFSDPLRLAASADPLRWQTLIQQARVHSVHLGCRKTLPVLFLTVNPFYPLYRQKNGQYEAEFVDKLELLKSMQTALPGWPVVDIQQPPLPDLLALAGLKSLKGQP